MNEQTDPPSADHRLAVAAPSAWIARFFAGIPPGGPVLDFACGGGRNLRRLRALGHPVTGLDRSLAGVHDLHGSAGVTLIEADLEAGNAFAVAGQRFAAVVVTNYLWRPLLAELVAATAADGLFLYETFAVGQARYGRPSNPDFLLRPGELLEAVRPALTVVAYAHGAITDDGRPRIVQRIAACGPRHPWAATGADV